LCHALPAWNGITLRRRGTYHLEEVLSDSEVLFLLGVLSNNSMNHSLKDVFLWYNTFHVFNEVISIISLIILKIVDDQIESSLWNDINDGWQYLKGIFTTSENDKIVSKKIVVLKDVARSARVLQHFEFGLSGFSVIELEMITSLQIDTDD
jgi:hypothetical protein